MYRKEICVVVSNMDTKEFFVSDKHDDFGLEGFIPCTHFSHTFFDGDRVEDIEAVIRTYYEGYININLLDLYPEKKGTPNAPTQTTT